MGTCRICKQSAGLLRSVHPECEQRYNYAQQAIQRLAQVAFITPTEAGQCRTKMQSIATSNNFPDADARQILVDFFRQSLDSALEDHLLTEDEEDRLLSFASAFGLSRDEMASSATAPQLLIAVALRDVLAGKTPVYPAGLPQSIPFLLQKAEQIVWLFPDAHYWEQRTRRQYVGGSQGVSFRVTRGVYYRVGGFRAVPVDKTETADMGVGTLAFTTKHIYFAGAVKSFRIPYSKIVGIEPHTDGITVTRDAATAKPQTFQTGNGWFTYNLAMQLAGRA